MSRGQDRLCQCSAVELLKVNFDLEFVKGFLRPGKR